MQTPTTVDVTSAPFDTTTASRPLWPAAGWLLGWFVTETTGAAAAVVELHDGQDASGPLIAVIPLAAGTMSAVIGAIPGVPLTAGLFLRVVSGSVAGSVTVARVEA